MRKMLLLLLVITIPTLAQEKQQLKAEYDFSVAIIGSPLSTLINQTEFPLKLVEGSMGGRLSTTGLLINAEILIPSAKIVSLYYLFGITISEKIRGGVDRYYDKVIVTSDCDLIGGGPYLGVAVEKKLFSGFGLIQKISLGYFSFRQQVIIDELFYGQPISIHSDYNSIITQFGGKLFTGLLFNFHGIKIKPGYSVLVVGNRSEGNVRLSGFEGTIGFSF